MPSLIETIGLIAVSYVIYRISFVVYFHFSPSTGSLDAYKSPDTWAIVTGGSAGIGHGFAQDLAARGFNLVLLSRTQKTLDSVRADLLAKNPNVKIETIAADSSTITAAQISDLVATRLSHLPISILINNIGGVPPTQHPFIPHESSTPQEIEGTLNMNSHFLALFTHHLIPILSRHKSRRALILNISSGSQIGLPMLVMYSAIKGFMLSFTLALGRDIAATGKKIDVLNVKLGDVQSRSNQEPLSWVCPTSEQFSKCCLDKVGVAVQLGLREITPYWGHAVQLAFLESVPEWVRTYALIDVMVQKKKYLEKLKAEGKFTWG